MAEETWGAEVETGENFAKRSAIADLDLGNVYPILRSMLGFYDFIQCPGSQCDRTTLEEILKIPSEMEVAPPHKRFTQFSALIKL